MALSLDQFAKLLTDSGLMSADDLAAYIEGLAEKPSDAEALARNLVEAKKLTPYQATEIWKGHAQQLVLGEYAILEKLGAGGMGEVYRARHRRMQRVVALKVLPESITMDEQAIKRFEREVVAAAKLTHPNIVTAYDAREDNGVTYLVMECVEGQDLSAIVKKQGPATVEQSINCIIQAARGLEYAHKNGVIHRDIKPANLLFDKEGTVKILDMGLARIDAAGVGQEDGTQAELTSTGTVMGTVDYMSPEQAADTKEADARADIYSLGCSLWYLLTARPVYEGTTLIKKIFAHKDQPIPSLKEARSEVPAALDGVFCKMVAKKLEDRYQTMTEVIADLEAIQAGGVPVATASSPGIQPVTTGRDVDSGMASFLNNLDAKESATDQTVIAPAEQQAAKGSDTFADSSGQLTKQRITPTQKLVKNPAGKNRNLFIGGSIAAVVLLGAIIWAFSGGEENIQDENAISEKTTKKNLTPDPTTNEWKTLFNGKDFTGWKPSGPPNLWSVRDGTIYATGNPEFTNGEVKLDGWLATDRPYENFTLEFEYRLPPQGASGVFLAVPQAEPAPAKKLNGGFEIQLLDDTAPKFANIDLIGTTGAIWGVAPARTRATALPNQWHFMQISFIGRQVTVSLNGDQLLETNLDDYSKKFSAIPGLKRSSGHIGFQKQQSDVEFRNIRIKEFKPDSTNSPPLAIAPFDEGQAKAHQQAWAEYLGLPVEKEVELPGGEKMTFMLIPPGEFMMGSSETEQLHFVEEAKKYGNSYAETRIRSEGPQHRVQITSPYYLGKYEVTQVQWNSVMGTNPSQFSTNLSNPVEKVNWDDVQSFLKKLNNPNQNQVANFIIPTEALWEYACRAGTSTYWNSGNDESTLKNHAWHKSNSNGTTHPVGQLLPNAFGLYDMHGNVWEWCSDWYAFDFYSRSQKIDPIGPKNGSFRVSRGASWIELSLRCRSSHRNDSAIENRFNNLGFRLAMTVDTAKLKGISTKAANYALAFDGIDDYVDIPTEGIEVIDDFTIEAWIDFQGLGPPKNVNDKYAIVLDWSGDTIFKLTQRRTLGVAGGNISALVLGKKQGQGAYTSWEVSGRKHVALVKKQDKFYLYVDARLAKSDNPYSNDSPPKKLPRNLRLGTDASNGINFRNVFRGQIDELRISQTARYEKAGFTPQNRFQSDQDTLALYHFDEGTGERLKDSSGNNHHGTIFGAKWVKVNGSSVSPIDLLKLIDPERDTIEGEFALENERLSWQPANSTRLQIPGNVPEQYDLVISATRTTTSEFPGLMIGLPVGNQQTMATIDHGFGSGLQLLDGKKLHENESLNRKNGLFRTGKEATIICSVRKSSVKVTFDGEVVVEWNGNPSRLSMHELWHVPNKHAIFIGGNVSYSINKLELRPIGSSVLETSPTDPDRAAAEWVLGIGGTVTTGAGVIKATEELPQQPFRITRINLASNTQVTDDSLEHLKGLTNLSLLYLSKTQVSDEGLKYLKGLTNLTHLELQDSQVGDAGLEHLKRLINLNTILIHDTLVRDEGLEHLKALTKLTTLTLRNNKISNDGVEHLKGLTNLEYLELGGTQVKDEGLEYLKGLTNLRLLAFSVTQVGDAGLEHLKGLTTLINLTLSKTKVTAAGVADLQKALPNCKITWDGAK